MLPPLLPPSTGGVRDYYRVEVRVECERSSLDLKVRGQNRVKSMHDHSEALPAVCVNLISDEE